MTNNYWEKDVSSKEVIYKILALAKKYTKAERKKLILSFSWWEPTLNKKLVSFIKLAKSLWIWIIQIQTNGTILYKNKNLINELIEAWLDELFLAQHSSEADINKLLGVYYNIDDFVEWINFVKKENIHKQLQISFNIVVTKINIFHIYDYVVFLLDKWFIDLLPRARNNYFLNTRRISFWLVQPNWYANINKEEVLLKYTNKELKEIDKIVSICKKSEIYPDFHFTAPSLCILNYPEYNLEYQRLKQIEKDNLNWKLNEENLDSYKNLWKEKKKYDLCKKCSNNNYCLWIYKNWIEYVWEYYVIDKITKFIT